MKYEIDTHVRYSEVDANGNLTWLALQAYFQDCSVFQSEHLKIGVDYLMEHHIAWVLSSWQICVDEMPRLADAIKVGTWAYDFKGFYGFRNFELKNSLGKRVAYANSLWVLVDTITGRPVKINPEMGELYGREPQLSMECSERKIPIPKEYEEKEPVRVQQYFIDTNQHMNNEKYVMIAQEYLPEDFQIGEIRVEYKKAAVLDDMIYPRVTVASRMDTDSPETVTGRSDDHNRDFMMDASSDAPNSNSGERIEVPDNKIEYITVVLADENGKTYAIVKFIAR